MRVLTADQAAALIRDDWTITTAGFGQCCGPEAVLEALERRFEGTGRPRGLSLVFGSACGDGASLGLNRIARAGLLKRVVGGSWASAPRIAGLAAAQDIEAESWPQSVIGQMFHAVAGGRPCVLSEAGIGTFVDPRCNDPSQGSRVGDPRVTLQECADRAMLLYRAEATHCGLLRGTRADANGNITMEREANLQDQLAQAQAVRTSGGIVIVQVMEVVACGALDPRAVHIPGHLVDFVVRAKPELHWQTYGEAYNSTYSGEWHGSAVGNPRPTQSNEAERVIARRAAMQLLKIANSQHRHRPLVVSAGAGLPEAVAAHLHHGGQYNDHRYTWTLESGVVGGMPIGGASSGASAGPLAFVSTAEQFDHYDGGGIDIAFLGFGAIDGGGRIDVCGPADLFQGVGGFINIAQSAKQLVFLGTFAAAGRSRFTDCVSRVCFDPKGRVTGDPPLVITELAVLCIEDGALVLLEVAPGIDVERDILNQSDCPIRIPNTPIPIPTSVFGHGPLEMPFVT